MGRWSKEKKAEVEAQQDSDVVLPESSVEQAEVLADAVEQKESCSFQYSVADGRSVTCLKGIVGSGEEVKAEYLSGAQETLDALVIRGVVVKAWD
jgi:hypothetical protein